jgi:putative endonuclease
MPWFLYMVECVGGRIYTGITVDVDRRMAEHASGRGAKFTRAWQIEKVLSIFDFEDRSSASKAEYAIKQLSALQKRLLATGKRALPC